MFGKSYSCLFSILMHFCLSKKSKVLCVKVKYLCDEAINNKLRLFNKAVQLHRHSSYSNYACVISGRYLLQVDIYQPVSLPIFFIQVFYPQSLFIPSL